MLLHSPTYIGFTSSLENNGRKIIHSDLVRDEAGVWRMDYDDMDAKIKKYKIHLAVFVLRTIPVGAYGSEKKLRRQWKYIKEMTVL